MWYVARETERGSPNHPLPSGSGDQDPFLPGFSATPAVKGWLGLSIETTPWVLVMDRMAEMLCVGGMGGPRCMKRAFSKKEQEGQPGLGVGLQRKGRCCSQQTTSTARVWFL